MWAAGAWRGDKVSDWALLSFIRGQRADVLTSGLTIEKQAPVLGVAINYFFCHWSAWTVVSLVADFGHDGWTEAVRC